jgi:Spy/CpxP family protein refolding chaperone
MFKNITQIIILLSIISSILIAQPHRPRKKPQEMVEHLMVYRLTELLSLTEDQSIKFFPKLKELKELRRDFADARRKLIERIEDRLRDFKGPEKDLKDLIAELEAKEKDFHEKEAKIHKEISNILTSQQYAKFLIFQTHFNEEIRKMIEEARASKRRWRRPRFW